LKISRSVCISEWLNTDNSGLEYLKRLKEKFLNTRYRSIAEGDPGSLEWIWSNKEFELWLQSDHPRLLHIEGKPGSGKSTIMKYLRKKLPAQTVGDGRRSLDPKKRADILMTDFFYSERHGDDHRRHENMLCKILHDILNQDESVFYHFQRRFRQAENEDIDKFDLHLVLKKILLEDVANHHENQKIYILVDAADESSSENRHDILNSFIKLGSTSRPHGSCVMKIVIGRRPITDMSQPINPSSKFTTIQMQKLNTDSLKNFVDSLLDSQDALKHLSKDDLRKIKQCIKDNAREVFLWVKLVVKELVEHARKKGLFADMVAHLHSLPQELLGMYSLVIRALQEKPDKSAIQDGGRMFRLVLCAQRPLSIEEFQHALATSAHVDAKKKV
jgi:hypothetical protein